MSPGKYIDLRTARARIEAIETARSEKELVDRMIDVSLQTPSPRSSLSSAYGRTLKSDALYLKIASIR